MLAIVDQCRIVWFSADGRNRLYGNKNNFNDAIYGKKSKIMRFVVRRCSVCYKRRDEGLKWKTEAEESCHA